MKIKISPELLIVLISIVIAITYVLTPMPLVLKIIGVFTISLVAMANFRVYKNNKTKKEDE